MAAALSASPAHPGAMNDNDNTQASIQQFRAPSWAADWCPKCDWAQTCLDCRACWIG